MCSKITTTLKQEAEKKSDVIYSNIISYCKSSNSPFIDDSFLHNKKSIGSLQFTKNGVKRHEEPDFLNWLRPSQMFTKDGRSSPWSVLNNPRPSDIEQGTLVGDCWLMSAMALIAERPDVLDDIIPKKQYSHYGVYQIKESGFLMCCHCGAFENVVAEAEFKAMGLLTNHAYSILDVIYEQGYRLLRIRNPWGQFVWNGKWSDGWPGWPIGMKQKFLNQRKDETGAFWMDLEDFVARFASVTVCKLRMDWSELRVTHKVGGHSDTALQIVITDTCEVSVTAFQKGAFNKKDNLNDLMVCVHRISGDRRIGELIEMSSRISDNHFTIDEFFLAPGEYQIVCHSQSSLLTNKKGVVNMVVHTRYPIFGEYIPMSPRTRMESLHHVIIKEGDIVKNTNDGVVIRTLTRKFRGMIIMADNCLEKKYLHVGVDCSQSMNIQSSRGFLQVVDVVPPLCRQVLLVLSTIDDSAQYRVSNSLKTLVHRSKCLLPEMWYEAAISAPNAQHYPLLNTSSFDPIHSTVSVF